MHLLYSTTTPPHMRLFSGSSHKALAQNIAKELKISLGKVTLKTFSCGENYVKFEESIRGKDLYLVQAPGQNPNDALIELCLLCQAATLSFAKSVHVILPCFPYARQDRVAEWREPISAKIIAHLLEESGADHLVTLTLHSDQIQGFFSIPVDALDARPTFAEYFKAKKIQDPIVVSPDVGGAKQAKKFADNLGTDLAILHKTRSGHNKAEIRKVVGEVEGKTCILYDDMIDTGGTPISAKKALLKHGANKEVYAVATHPIFSGDAIKNLQKAAFKEVVVTDSVPVKRTAFKGLTVLPIAPLLAKVIKHIEKGESVTDIYKS